MNNIAIVLDECESLLQAGNYEDAIMKLAPLSFYFKKYEDYAFLKLQLINTDNELILEDLKQRIQKEISILTYEDIIENAIKRYEKYRLCQNNMIYRIPVNQKKEVLKLSEKLSQLGPKVQQSFRETKKIFLNIENAIRDMIIEYRILTNYCMQNSPVKNDYVIIVNIINRFGEVARQLLKRHHSRSTIKIKDEYDVQDLFHALLRLHFEDVRTEEWTPSYAGGASRMDFLIKELHLAIEIKYATDRLRNAQLKKQLAEDKDQYKIHPDVKKLLCFVYDPNHWVDNPRGFENDLKQDCPLETEVLVRD